MNREALEALREKVEAGEDPSWADVECCFVRRDTAIYPIEVDNAIHAYRGSLDAAKALHDTLLSGWDWSIKITVDGPLCQVNLPFSKAVYSAATFDNNPARSWLLAILSALIAQTEEGE